MMWRLKRARAQRRRRRTVYVLDKGSAEYQAAIADRDRGMLGDLTGLTPEEKYAALLGKLRVDEGSPGKVIRSDDEPQKPD